MKQGQIRIKKPLKGIAKTYADSHFGTSARGAVDGVEGEYSWSGGIDLYTFGKHGHLAPGQALIDMTDSGSLGNGGYVGADMTMAAMANIVGTPPTNASVASVLLSNDAVNGASSILDRLNIARGGAHASHTGVPTDLLIATSTSGVEYGYVSFYDEADCDIARYTTGGTCNTSGTTVTKLTGNDFTGMTGTLRINGTNYTISSVTDYRTIELTGSAGTQSAVVWQLQTTSSTYFSGLSGSGLLSGSSAKPFPHNMSVGTIESDIYITNGQYLASMDTNAGTGNTQALNLGSGWLTTDVCRFGNYMAIAGNQYYQTFISSTSNKDGGSRVWLWDGYSSDPNFFYDVPMSNIYTIVNFRGTLVVFGTASGRGAMAIFTGSRFELVFSHVYIAVPSGPGLVEIINDRMYWIGGTSGDLGGLWCYDGNGVHHISGDASIYGGFLRNLYSTLLYTTSTTGGNYTKIGYAGQSRYQVGPVWTSRVYELPYKSTIDKITVYFSQFASASSVTLKVYDNYTATSGTPKYTQTINTSNFASVVADMSAVMSHKIANLNAFYITLTFDHSAVTDTAAIVREIVVDYTGELKP